MHYTTVTVGLVVEQEIQVGASEIEQAIAQGLKTLSEEINGPVELVNVIPVPTHQGLCLVVMAKPYEPPVRFAGTHAVQDILLQQAHQRGLGR